MASTRASASDPSSPSALNPNISSSRTVLQQICRSGFWKRKPMRRASSLVFREVVGTPSMSTSPEVGFKSPFASRIVVDFPAPLVPIIPSMSPFSSENETSFTARNSSARY